MFLSCEDEQDKYGALHIEINVTQDQGTAAAKIASSDIAKVTITISGMDPINIDVSSGTNVSRTIEDVPIGEQIVTVDLKNSSNTIYYTQTQAVEVEAGKTASPIFNDFTPKNLFIAVTSPNGGETWQLGTTHNITWTSSHSSEPVTIDLYLNGSWADSIGSHINNTGSFSWGIPASINESNLYKIKISYSTVTTNDFSDEYFTLSSQVQPIITVTSPNGGEDWGIGSTQTISWTSEDLIGWQWVTISLYKNGSFDSQIVSWTDNDGSYSWTISSSLTESDYCKIRINDEPGADYEEFSVYDESDSYFSLSAVTQATLIITSPNGGEEWELGSTQEITWTSSDLSGNVKIELYKSGSIEETLSADESNDGSYSWSVSSSLAAGTDYRVRISSVSDASVYDESDADFELSAAPTITVTSPNGGESWVPGSSQEITWTSSGASGYVAIYLYSSGSYSSQISSAASNDGSYTWSISSSQAETEYYQVKIVDYSDTDVYDLSDDYFTISSSASGETVTDIDGNVYGTVEIGDQVWMKENLKVTHYRNGDEIPTGYSNSEWADLDETETGAYAVYEDNESNADVYGNLYNWYAVDDSRGACPEEWHIPTDDEIKELEMHLGMSQSEADDTGWRGTNEGSKLAGRAELWSSGNLENDPEFGTSGLDFLPGGYRYDTNGYYNRMGIYGYFWSSTEDGNNLARNRVLDYNSSAIRRAIYYKRDGFSVRCVRDSDTQPPIITITSPNGGEDWEQGSTHDITWTSQDLSSSYVKIKLYRSGSDVGTLSNQTSDNGSYSWSIPSSQTESIYYQVRIEEYNNTSVYDMSDNYFTISSSGSSGTCDDCLNDYTDFGSECCDTAWEEYSLSCAELESTYGWDCSGCNCPGDSDGGGDGEDPCSGVSCDNYCSGDYRYYNGDCTEGSCYYSIEYCSNGCSNGSCNSEGSNAGGVLR